MESTTCLKRKANEIRQEVLKMIYHASAGHIGGAYSCTDILTVLYYDVMNIDPKRPNWTLRDRFILSKGHCVEPLWVILADKGFFPKEELTTFSAFGTRLIGHPNNKVSGIEVNTGSLGHGLPVAVGIALAAKKDNKDYRTFTIMGDGEQAEGSVWEAAMAATHYQLDNLIAIVDRNKLQISGTTEQVMSLEPFDQRWQAFGWEVIEVDGHDMNQLKEVLSNTPKVVNKPTLIVAHTIKGRGISMAEHNPSWHHHVPTAAEYEKALAELKQEMEAI